MSEYAREVAKDILLTILPDSCEEYVKTVSDQSDQHRAYAVVDIDSLGMFPESISHAMREHALSAVSKFFIHHRKEFTDEASLEDGEIIDYIMSDERFEKSRSMRITVMLLGTDIPKYGFIMVDPEERLMHTNFTRDPSIMYGTVLGFPAQDFKEMADYIKDRLESSSGHGMEM